MSNSSAVVTSRDVYAWYVVTFIGINLIMLSQHATLHRKCANRLVKKLNMKIYNFSNMTIHTL